MIEIPEQHKKYYEEVVEFAKRLGKWDNESDLHSLKRWLDYLDSYYDKRLTKTELYPDSPHGFGFVIYRAIRSRECKKCQATWTSAVNFLSSGEERGEEKKEHCFKCFAQEEQGDIASGDIEWRKWFNGGLLYHGAVDGYGSGSGPVFAVTLTPTDGWSIHT